MEPWGYSNAQNDHRAFWWLEETKVLVVPVVRRSVDWFDGFAVYDVLPNDPDKNIVRRFKISHTVGQ